MDDTLSIAELRDAVGGDLTLRSIRFYESLRLLTPVNQAKCARRRYSPDAVITLRKIGVLKEAGFSLDEIARALSDLGSRTAKRKQKTMAHSDLLREVRAKIAKKAAVLRKLTREIDTALENAELCASCGSQDCSKCGRLKTWTDFGLAK